MSAPDLATRTADELAALVRAELHDSQSRWSDGPLVEELHRLDAADPEQPFARGKALLVETIATRSVRGARLAPSGRARYGGPAYQVTRVLFHDVLHTGLLDQREIEALLLEFPWLMYRIRFSLLPSQTREDLHEIVNRPLERVLGGDSDPALNEILVCCHEFVGIDRLLAACRQLDRYPKAKLPTPEQVTVLNTPTDWAAAILRYLRPPGPADLERRGELAAITPSTLLKVALYCPSWSPLVEAVLRRPGLAALVRWLHRHRGPFFWENDPPHNWEELKHYDPGVVDRAAAAAIVAEMGEERVREILRDRLARQLYRDSILYFQAALGWNAADVEALFLKRAQRAVRALGMFPDEGDVLDRYLALRRFARESREFGAERQANERAAVETALANLAHVAGYLDAAQLEWTMEARLAQDLDPTARRWTIGEYTAWIDPVDTSVVAERDGKRLKTVPPAVRHVPEYEEIKEGRRLLREQVERVRRRLELAMALGEVLSYETFAPALATPAGRQVVSGLVLRCWSAGAAAPREISGSALCEAAAEPPERVQVAHPLHLIEAGTLEAWRRRFAGQPQPFEQLFRACYRASRSEQQTGLVRRLAGREVVVGALREQLKRRGWRPSNDGADYARRFPGGCEARLSFVDALPYHELLPEDPLVVDLLSFGGAAGELATIDPLHFSEALRDADLATTAAARDRATAPISPEVAAVRAAQGGDAA